MVYDGVNELRIKESKSEIQQVDTSDKKKEQLSTLKWKPSLEEVLKNGSYYDVAKQNAILFIKKNLRNINSQLFLTSIFFSKFSISIIMLTGK